MSIVMERLRDALNSHDAQRMAALFAEDYASSQPVHSGRTFGGRAQVAKNWTALFEAVPDLTADIVSSSIDGDTHWSEWHWHGQNVDGSPFAMRGVTIMMVRDGLIAEARLYMEPVDTAAEDIDAAVRELTRQPPAQTS
jgi:ketosteroid isomerase-like protein